MRPNSDGITQATASASTDACASAVCLRRELSLVSSPRRRCVLGLRAFVTARSRRRAACASSRSPRPLTALRGRARDGDERHVAAAVLARPWRALQLLHGPRGDQHPAFAPMQRAVRLCRRASAHAHVYRRTRPTRPAAAHAPAVDAIPRSARPNARPTPTPAIAIKAILFASRRSRTPYIRSSLIGTRGARAGRADACDHPARCPFL
jgi:hypothetical protein